MTPWGMRPVKASLWVCGKFCKSAIGRAPMDQQNQDHLGICEESQAPRGPTESKSLGVLQESLLANPSGAWGNHKMKR